jgi:hypothetical protein
MRVSWELVKHIILGVDGASLGIWVDEFGAGSSALDFNIDTLNHHYI